MNKKFKILHVSGELDETSMRMLNNVAEVRKAPNLTSETIRNEAEDIDAIIIGSQGVVDKEVLENARNLKVVGRFGAGYVNVDVDTATERGIAVVYSGTANSDTVADLTFGLLLTVSRNISWADRAVKSAAETRWDITVRPMFKGTEVWNKTLGVIGLGKIGSRVVKRAKGFDMNVLVFDPYISDEKLEEAGVKRVGLQTLLRESDFISIHTRCTKETKSLISENQIKIMKNSAYLINTAESGIVDEDALYMALVNGGLRGAAIDVPEWELGESYTFDAQRPLYKLDNCVITPVIAAMTEEALSRMIRICVKEVITVLKGEKPTWIANPSVTTTSGVK